MAGTKDEPTLFDTEAFKAPPLKRPKFKPERVWTETKAVVIRDYLRTFQLVTKHGVYIDAFAGMLDKPSTWAAKLVLEIDPGWLRSFHLFDLDADKVRGLEGLKAAHPDRNVAVVQGDSNIEIPKLLSGDAIGPSTAAFALLDQYTNECHWATVQALANHKERYKIELFYFLANEWMGRSLATVGDAKARRWWGRPDWRRLTDMSGTDRAALLARRFREELGYGYATEYAIYKHGERAGSVHYFMIHASDHRDAPRLMGDAYRRRLPPVPGTGNMFPETS